MHHGIKCDSAGYVTAGLDLEFKPRNVLIFGFGSPKKLVKVRPLVSTSPSSSSVVSMITLSPLHGTRIRTQRPNLSIFPIKLLNWSKYLPLGSANKR